MRHLLCGLAILWLGCSGAQADPVADRDLYLVSGALVLATAFDSETTFAGIESGRAHESNAVMRPFVNSGRPAVYAVEFAADAAILFLAYRMKERGDHRWWWIPSARIAGHTVAGSLNLRFIF
jgi:hypothetical protein